MKVSRAAILVMVFLFGGVANAQDWDSCASDLDDIRRAADDANDAAEAAGTAKREVDNARDQLQNCVNFPSAFDLYRDRCQSYRYEYQSAVDTYRSKLNYLKSELSDLDSQIRSASTSCGYGLASVGTPSLRPAPANSSVPQAWCNIYLQYKDSLPRDRIMAVCRKTRSEAECAKCID